MQCSIVIRAYNEEKHLGRLLEGITHQTVREVEIILVDSGSIDSTVSIAQTHGAKVVHIPPADFTFGRSLNKGIQNSTSGLIVIASAHVYPVYPDWLECLLRPFMDERVALVYGKQRGDALTKFSEQQIFRQWYPETDRIYQPSPFCNNANAAIRRELWEKRPYNETLTGLEDVDWANWARSNVWEVCYSAHAEAVHAHSESPRGVYNRYRREGMGFKLIFPESHFNIYDFTRLSVSNILSDIYHATRQGVAAKNLLSIFWFRFMQFWGTYQGYRHSRAVDQHLRQTFYYPRGLADTKHNQREVEPIRYNRQP